MEALDPCPPGGSTEVPTHLCICEPPGNSWECVEPKTLGVFLCLLKKVPFKDMGVNLVGLVLCRVRSQLFWVGCPCSILSPQRAPRLRTTWKHWQPFIAATATWEHLLLVCCCSRSGVNFLEEKKKKKRQQRKSLLKQKHSTEHHILCGNEMSFHPASGHVAACDREHSILLTSPFFKAPDLTCQGSEAFPQPH